MGWTKRGRGADIIAGERRGDRRYRIRLEMRWRSLHRQRILETGDGQTVDISSGGILFDAGRQLPTGLRVELSIFWPVLLHNVAPLQLAVSGRIVRSENKLAAIRITHHEFRTIGIAPERRKAATAGLALGSPWSAGFGRVQ